MKKIMRKYFSILKIMGFVLIVPGIIFTVITASHSYGQTGFYKNIKEQRASLCDSILHPVAREEARSSQVYPVMVGDKLGFIDSAGQYVIEPEIEIDYFNLDSNSDKFSEGMLATKRQGKYGYRDNTGKMVIEPQYDQAKIFSEGAAAVKMGGKWGYIDKSGEYLIKPQFDFVRSFSEGLASVRINGKAGFIDQSGNMVIKPQFPLLSDFKNGSTYLVGPEYNINRDGEKIDIGHGFDCKEGLFCIKRNDKWGYADVRGDIVIEPVYDRVRDFKNGIAMVIKDDKIFFINSQGEVLFEMPDDIQKGNCSMAGCDFSEGRIEIRGNNLKCGYLDKSGHIKVLPIYKRCEEYSDGLAAVSRNDKWGYIDKDGHITINQQFLNACKFIDNLAPVLVEDGWGYINKKGEFVWKTNK